MTKTCLTIASIIILAAVATAQTPKPAITVTRGSGGSVRTPLDYNISVNKESSLSREWITIHDPSSPLALIDNVGVTTRYVRDQYRGEYRYSTKLTVEPSEPLAAFEIRFLLFDIWGNHLQTLSMTRVMDLAAKSDISSEWNAFTENEVSEYYASIAFVARVRTQGGRVFNADTMRVLEEARKFSRKFSPENLEPKPAKSP